MATQKRIGAKGLGYQPWLSSHTSGVPSPVVGAARERLAPWGRARQACTDTRRVRVRGFLLAVLALGIVLPAHGAIAGPAVHRIILGTDAGTVVVDEQLGRAFVGGARPWGAQQARAQVSVVDIRTGVLLRTVPLPLLAACEGGNLIPMAVAVRTARIFIASSCDWRIAVLDARSGTLRSTVSVGRVSSFAVDDADGLVYTGGTGLSALDARTGRVRASLVPATLAETGPLTVLPDRGTRGSRNGRIVTWTGTSIATLDLRGHQLGSVRIGRNDWVVAVVGDQRTRLAFAVVAAVLTPSYRVLTVDTDNGRLLATVTAPTDPTTAVVDEHTGRLFVAAAPDGRSPGIVQVLDAHSGQVLRRVSVPPNPRHSAVDERAGQVYVVSDGPLDSHGLPMGHGTLSILSANDGTVLQTIPVGEGTTGVAIDPSTGRVITTSWTCPMQSSRAKASGTERRASPLLAQDWGCVLVIDPSHAAGDSR